MTTLKQSEVDKPSAIYASCAIILAPSAPALVVVHKHVLALVSARNEPNFGSISVSDYDPHFYCSQWHTNPTPPRRTADISW